MWLIGVLSAPDFLPSVFTLSHAGTPQNAGRETEYQKGSEGQGHMSLEVVATLKGVCPSEAFHGGWRQGGTYQV